MLNWIVGGKVGGVHKQCLGLHPIGTRPGRFPPGRPSLDTWCFFLPFEWPHLPAYGGDPLYVKYVVLPQDVFNGPSYCKGGKGEISH